MDLHQLQKVNLQGEERIGKFLPYLKFLFISEIP